MASTDNTAADRSIRKFFKQWIGNVRHDSNIPSRKYFETDFDAHAESYFESPRYPQYLYHDFADFKSREELRALLENFFRSNGDDDLAEMSADLSELVYKLKESMQDQTEDLNSYIYTMY